MRKASLGAGWSLGLAHDIGEAAAWLCQNGWDGVSAALATIQTKPGTLASTRSDDRWIIGPAPIGLAGPAALDLVVATFAPVEILLTDDPLLFLGLICNSMVRPVDHSLHMTEDELARERALQHDTGVSANAQKAARGAFGVTGVLAWLAVGVPFLIGLYIALAKAAALF